MCIYFGLPPAKETKAMILMMMIIMMIESINRCKGVTLYSYKHSSKSSLYHIVSDINFEDKFKPRSKI